LGLEFLDQVIIKTLSCLNLGRLNLGGFFYIRPLHNYLLRHKNLLFAHSRSASMHCSEAPAIPNILLGMTQLKPLIVNFYVFPFAYYPPYGPLCKGLYMRFSKLRGNFEIFILSTIFKKRIDVFTAS